MPGTADPDPWPCRIQGDRTRTERAWWRWNEAGALAEPRGDLPGTPDKIVVGVDGSESSKAALAWAARQAKLTRAPLEVVSAWEFPTSLGWALPWPEGLDFAAEAEAVAVAQLAQLVPEVLEPEPGIELRRTVVEGPSGARPRGPLTRRRPRRRGQPRVRGARGHAARLGQRPPRLPRALSARHRSRTSVSCWGGASVTRPMPLTAPRHRASVDIGRPVAPRRARRAERSGPSEEDQR